MAYGVAEHQSKPLLNYGIFILLSVVLGTTGGALVSGPTNKNVTVGQHVILPCSTDLDLPVFWYFNGHEIFYGGRVAMSFQTMFDVSNNIKGEYNLVISSADFSYNGEYICGDDEGQGERKSAHLYVTGQASVTVADMGSTTSGDNANIPLIIGVVAGSLALLLSIVVIVVCLRRKSDSKSNRETPAELETKPLNQESTLTPSREPETKLAFKESTLTPSREPETKLAFKENTLTPSREPETKLAFKENTLTPSREPETKLAFKENTLTPSREPETKLAFKESNRETPAELESKPLNQESNRATPEELETKLLNKENTLTPSRKPDTKLAFKESNRATSAELETKLVNQENTLTPSREPETKLAFKENKSATPAELETKLLNPENILTPSTEPETKLAFKARVAEWEKKKSVPGYNAVCSQQSTADLNAVTSPLNRSFGKPDVKSPREPPPAVPAKESEPEKEARKTNRPLLPPKPSE